MTPKSEHAKILVELLKMRGVSEEHAKIAADFFQELAKTDRETPGINFPISEKEPEESLNDFIRELLERALLLPVQMFLDRLPDEQRERLKKRIVL